MSLPLKAIERLFDRLGATYGREWTGKWDGIDDSSVKSLWAHELSAFADRERMTAVAWALENLPEKCPNAIQFRNLCRQAPQWQALQLDAPKADPRIVDAEMAKIAATALRSSSNPEQRGDPLAWAKRLKARHDKGEKLGHYQIFCYRKALGLDEKAAA